MPGSLKGRDDREVPGPLAKLFMLASTLLVAALFAYVIHQAVTAPEGGEPRARLVSTTTTDEGELRVEVAVRNDGERGLREITVEIPCDSPPPDLTLGNIPAQGERRGIVICPAGAEDVVPTIASYVWT